MPDFKKGDTVRLKSGGPLMTIDHIGNFGPLGPEIGARCVWFERNEPQERVFDVAVLEISDNNAHVAAIGRPGRGGPRPTSSVFRQG